MQRYVASARAEEKRALHAVELAYHVAEHLANYDLDAAEQLLDSSCVVLVFPCTTLIPMLLFFQTQTVPVCSIAKHTPARLIRI